MTVPVGTNIASCFGCVSPDGKAAPAGEWGSWVASGVNSINGSQSWGWLRQMPLPYPADVQSTAVPSTPNPVAFNQPNLAPGANQTLAVSGGSASTSNPTLDGNRRIVGQIPGTSVAVSNPA
jgi:hypothetical protein